MLAASLNLPDLWSKTADSIEIGLAKLFPLPGFYKGTWVEECVHIGLTAAFGGYLLHRSQYTCILAHLYSKGKIPTYYCGGLVWLLLQQKGTGGKFVGNNREAGVTVPCPPRCAAERTSSVCLVVWLGSPHKNPTCMHTLCLYCTLFHIFEGLFLYEQRHRRLHCLHFSPLASLWLLTVNQHCIFQQEFNFPC